MPIITTGVAAILAGGFRSVSGWIENSFKDGKIDKYEWFQLGSTVLRVGVMTLAIAFGAGTGAAESGGLAILADYLLYGLKKVGQ